MTDTRQFSKKVNERTRALGLAISDLRVLTGADELRTEVDGIEYVVVPAMRLKWWTIKAVALADQVRGSILGIPKVTA